MTEWINEWMNEMDRSITLQETAYVNMVQFYFISYSNDFKLQCIFVCKLFISYLIF